jgi:hypothetical protein
MTESKSQMYGKCYKKRFVLFLQVIQGGVGKKENAAIHLHWNVTTREVVELWKLGTTCSERSASTAGKPIGLRTVIPEN